MRGIVPDAVLERRNKLGFLTPERAWLTSRMGQVEELVAGGRFIGSGFVDPPAVQAVMAAAGSGAGSDADMTALWRCLSMASWMETFS